MLGGTKTKDVKQNNKTNLKTLQEENTKMIKIKKYKEMNIIKIHLYLHIYTLNISQNILARLIRAKENLDALSTQKELKGESESPAGIQAGNLNNEALHVVGLHGSGETKSLFLQDW